MQVHLVGDALNAVLLHNIELGALRFKFWILEKRERHAQMLVISRLKFWAIFKVLLKSRKSSRSSLEKWPKKK